MNPSNISTRPVNRVGQYTVRSRTTRRDIPWRTIERQDHGSILTVAKRMKDEHGSAEIWASFADASVRILEGV